MVIDIILSSIILIALSVASYTDIKTREVPDWLSYGTIFAGLGLRLIYSIANADSTIVINGIYGLTLFLAIACLMYYTGQWGGGDSKLLMGIGALMGLEFSNNIPTLFIFFINTLLAGALYGIIWVCVQAVRHHSQLRHAFRKMFHQSILLQKIALLTSVMLLLIIAAFSTQKKLFIAAFAPLALMYLFLFIKSVENITAYKKILPTKLTEGDWIARPITINKKVIAAPSDLGANKEQIKKLIALYHAGKIKTVLIKEGIPFIPAFLLGFLLTLVLGDWITTLVLSTSL